MVEHVLNEAPDGTLTFTSADIQTWLSVVTDPSQTIPWLMLDPTGEAPWGGYEGTVSDPFGPGFVTAWADSRLDPNLTQVWAGVFTGNPNAAP